MKTLFSKFQDRFAELSEDERGAESSEVILVLVLLVIGLMAAWQFLKGVLDDKTRQIGNCINGAASDGAACEGGDPDPAGGTVE